MGRMKELLIDQYQESKEEWIRDWLGLEPDDTGDEHSAEWIEAELEFESHQDYLADKAAYEYEIELEQQQEIEWLKANPHVDIFKSYSRSLQEITKIDNGSNNRQLILMQVAYTVTIMESCLSEMLKSLVISSSDYMRNALCNIEELKERNFSLLSAYDLESKLPIEKIVLDCLSEMLYHNLPKVMKVYAAILNNRYPKDMDLSALMKLASLRHDIVHRDGKKKDGTRIIITSDDVIKYIDMVRSFLSIMNVYITSAVKIDQDKKIANAAAKIRPF